MNNFWNKGERQAVNGTILLRNKPDPGSAFVQCIALGFVSLFFFPFFSIWLESFDITLIEDLLFSLLIFALPVWIIFVLIIEIYWGFLGCEIVYYSEAAIYIQQKQSFRRDVVIPWDCITGIEPYDEPILYYALPTHDPTICITYKKTDGETKKFRFGYHLSPKQRELVIDRLQELLVKNFG